MLKYSTILFGIIACVYAKPSGVVAPFGYSAPLLAAPGIVAATSSQVVARNYNGLAAPLVAAAPAPVAIAAPAPLAVAAHAPLAYSDPLLRYTAPSYHPYAAHYAAHPYAAHYAAHPYSAYYGHPLAAAGQLVL